MTLEELGLEYDVKGISFKNNEQKEPWFLKVGTECSCFPALLLVDESPQSPRGAHLSQRTRRQPC